MKSQRNPGSIPIPAGDVKTETPDGVSKTYDDEVCNSAYDAMFFGDKVSYGAFTREGDGPFITTYNQRETTSRKKKD